jgi:hypothetical protein
MELQLLGQKPIFPEITHFKYLLDILSDMGYGIQSDGLTFQEIESFCRLSDIELSRVEIVALRGLSFDYINMLQKAKSKDCEIPYSLSDS